MRCIAGGIGPARRQMTRVACVLVVSLFFVASTAIPAFALLPYYAFGWATSSNGSYLTAYGTAGNMYAYARPTSGVKVNSIYVKAPGDPSRYLVEAGYTSTGDNPGGGLPANHNPWFFTVNGYAGYYFVDDFFYQYSLPVGQRTQVSIFNTGTGSDHDWVVYYGNTPVKTWYDTAFMYGLLEVGEERTLTSIDPRASITYMMRMAKEGTSYPWYYWWNGVGDHYDVGWYSFKFNHVGDSNHWVYCDDHLN